MITSDKRRPATSKDGVLEAGKGKYRVWLKIEKLDAGVVCILGGGERSHVGGCVIAEPGKKPKVLDVEGHYDVQVLLPIAEAACRKYNMPAAALGGVHIDKATESEIQILVANCEELAKCI